jgi:hypothetical protein
MASGDEKISDSVLTYAMTLALPESWSTQKQNLWMESPLTSEKVMAAMDWDMGRMDGVTAQTVALSAKQQFACTLHRTNGHTNAHCIKQGGAPAASYLPKDQHPSFRRLTGTNPAPTKDCQTYSQPRASTKPTSLGGL